jgi:hypothetical protein
MVQFNLGGCYSFIILLTADSNSSVAFSWQLWNIAALIGEDQGKKPLCTEQLILSKN